MLLGKSYAAAENAADSDWFPLPGQPEPGEGKEPAEPIVRFRIRRVPGGKLDELRIKIFGRKQSVRYYRSGTREEDLDRELDIVFKTKVAAFAFVDAENAEWGIGDAGEAERWTKLLGRPVSAGEQLPMDAKLPREAIEAILEESNYLREFVYISALSLGGPLAAQSSALGKA
jgi:hypothetical protein